VADADAIVIGSGHNGLVAAFCLAQAGWRVVVIERAAKIGGAVRTESVTLPGFRHDLYATNLSLFTGSRFYRDHRVELESAGLRFITCHEAFASAYQNDRSVRITTHAEQTDAEFAQCTASDREGWRRLVSIFRRVAPHVLPFTSMPLASAQAAAQALRMLVGLRGGVLELRHVIFGSSRQLVDRFFRTEEAKGALLPWAFHLDFGPDVKGGAAFASLAAVSAHLNGLVVAQGGADAIATALRRLIEDRGGIICTATEVTEVLVEDGRAVGVRTAGGDILSAARAVIANVTPRLLFGRLLPAYSVPDDVRKRAFGFRYGPGAFMVHLALSRHVAWKAGEDLHRFMYVHLNGKADEIAATYAQCTNGLLPSRPLIVVSQPTHADPSRAPTGSAVMRLQVRAVPASIAGDAAGSIRARHWAGVKEAFADRIVAQLEEHAPGARDLILARHVMSPDDFEGENPNLIGGDCVSGSHHLDQNYLARPFPGWTRYRTPVERLFMVGASTWPGGGVNAASGYLVAAELLRDTSKKARQRGVEG
jgi:phytoene dehydrogenase-like protein